MPTKAVSNSTYLSVLGYQAAFNLITRTLTVNLSPTVWTNNGNNSVQGARLIVASPSGTVLVNGAGFAFVPPMTGTVNIPLPTFDDVIEWGVYQFRVVVVLPDGGEVAIDGTFDLCAPSEVSQNNGTAALRIDADCEAGTIKVSGGEGYAYKGVGSTAWAKNYTFYYPNDSGQAPAPFNALPAIFSLFTGLSTVKGYSDGTFAFPDNYSVTVRYEADADRYVQCNFPCHLWCAYEKLVDETANLECGTRSHQRSYEKLMQANIYVPLVLLGIRCNRNVDKYIGILEEILGVADCPCGDDETVLVGVAQAAPTTTTTTQGVIAAPTTTTTTPPPTTTTTTAPTTTTTTVNCAEVSDIVYSII